MNCKFCGAPINDGLRFCTFCGRKTPREAFSPAAQAVDAPRPAGHKKLLLVLILTAVFFLLLALTLYLLRQRSLLSAAAAPEPAAVADAPAEDDSQQCRLPDGDYRFTAIDYAQLVSDGRFWYAPVSYHESYDTETPFAVMTREAAGALCAGDSFWAGEQFVSIENIAPVSYAMDELGDWDNCPLLFDEYSTGHVYFSRNSRLEGWGVNAFDYEGFTVYEYYILYSESEDTCFIMNVFAGDSVALRPVESSEALTTVSMAFDPSIAVKLDSTFMINLPAPDYLTYDESSGYYLASIEDLRYYWINDRDSVYWGDNCEVILATVKGGVITGLRLCYAP